MGAAWAWEVWSGVKAAGGTGMQFRAARRRQHQQLGASCTAACGPHAPAQWVHRPVHNCSCPKSTAPSGTPPVAGARLARHQAGGPAARLEQRERRPLALVAAGGTHAGGGVALGPCTRHVQAIVPGRHGPASRLPPHRPADARQQAGTGRNRGGRKAPSSHLTWNRLAWYGRQAAPPPPGALLTPAGG